MANIDLDELSLEELKQLEREVAKAIKSFEARKLSEARAAAEAAAKEHGFSLEDVVSGKSKVKGVAKYRDPENPSATWTGRGRKPNWVLAALERGVSLDELSI